MVVHRIILLTALVSATLVGTAQAQAPAAAGGKSGAGKKAATATGAKAAPGKKPGADQGSGAGSTSAAPAPASGVKPEERAREMTVKMTQALGLTPEQAKRVQAINLQSVERVEEARRTYVRQLPRLQHEIDVIGQSRLSLLKDVLTEQQFRAYAAMREKKMGIPDALKKQAEAAGMGDQ